MGKAKRFTYIDALRGIAALSVVFYHMRAALLEGGVSWWPQELEILVGQMSLGVQVFFVLSGFVIAYSLREMKANARYVGNFVVRRSLRLDPPYWASMGLVMVLASVSNLVFTDRVAELPSLSSILAHMFYAQDLLGIPQIEAIYWTLCMEFQFYLVFVLLLWASRKWAPAWRSALWSGLLFLSIACAKGVVDLPIPGLFLTHWYMFFVGVLGWWALNGEIKVRWFALAMLTIGVSLIDSAPLETIVVLATIGSIFAIGRKGALTTTWNRPWIQYLGKISYSLYLIHPIIGAKVVNLCLRFWGSDMAPGLVMLVFFGSSLASIVAADLFFRLIEAPSARLVQLVRRGQKGTVQPRHIGVFSATESAN
jgi:hypothetical protein